MGNRTPVLSRPESSQGVRPGSGAPLQRAEIVERILEIAPGLHTATTFPAKVLRAIARHLEGHSIQHSVETGSGASTLLFSHYSEDHTVFADDAGSGSVRNVEASSLLRPGVVRFIEGPTQRNLPSHRFANRIQAALLDGPHAYPFPDLEYYFLYPHLDPGALLVVDDIQIRSVHNLFEFLRCDRMFRLDQVVHTTAFFTRTDAAALCPTGDGWWQQEYNSRPLMRYLWPERLKSLAPQGLRGGLSRLKRKAWQQLRHPGCEVRILRPRGDEVGSTGTVVGGAMLPERTYLWVLVRRADASGWGPQRGPVPVCDRRWSVNVDYGQPRDAGHFFEICALAVGPATTQEWLRWLDRAKAAGSWPPVTLPAAEFVRAETYARVRKSSEGKGNGAAVCS